MKINVFKIELMVIDFDRVGAEEIQTILENNRYPNHCMSPQVKKIECREIEWENDEHPLNKRDTCETEYQRLFQEN